MQTRRASKRLKENAAGSLPAPPVASRHVPLPNEIVDQIIGFLLPPTSLIVLLSIDGTERKSPFLSNVALVSRQWSQSARRARFAEVHIEWRPITCSKLCHLIFAYPTIAKLVKTLVVYLTDKDQRIENWRRSPAGLKVMDEASELFPWPDEDDEPPDDYDEYIEDRAEAAAHAVGDDIWWPEGNPGDEDASNLRQLSMRNVRQDVDAAVLAKAHPVLSNLTTVSVDGCYFHGNDPFPFIKYLDSVQTLLLETSGRTKDLPGLTAGPRHGGALRHLRAAHDFQFNSLTLDLTKLVAIDLSSPSHQNILDLVHLLPTLRDLKFLCLVLPLDSDRTLVLNALRPTSLTYLSLNFWPTTAELSILPSSLQVLALGSHESESEAFDGAAGVCILAWKDKFFPQLSLLCIANLSDPAFGYLYQQAQLAGFTLGHHFRPHRHDGVWHRPETWM
ncbi:hypothetical protein RQP46_005545 [Phenoliferia psychrophenolica]